jgi:predicted CXXCH cytochrome family protein
LWPAWKNNETNAVGKKKPSSEAKISAAAADAPGTSGEGAPLPSDPPRSYWQLVRLNALRLAAVLGALLLLLAFLTSGAAQYTSRSEFCVSCHIMEPYYVSWQESTHKDVSCIKCHFPPGAAEKIRGKMLGLVQLLKYVTETAGPRPAAEISDASCLRCHDTRLLAGRVEFNGVPFDHRPHLTDLRRGKRLRCTSCHSQIVQGSHMTVTTSTCFLCHFKDGLFNEGLGTCTRCHQIPEGTFDLGGGVEFSHDLAYERGVDCANCHGDLIRGNGEVPQDRCTRCHNRPHDLERINDPVFLHQTHVTDHKIDCLECHLEIQHSLDPLRIEHAASDCKSCHPNQHGEQIRMLLGEGGKSHVEGARPNRSSMAGAGVACPSCHQVQEISATGTILWRASTAICTQCHDEAATERLQAHHERLKASLADIETALSRAGEAVPAAGLDASRAAEVNQRLRDLSDDLQFLRVGNSIHNMHYADSLIRALVENLRTISRDLNITEPAIDIPPELD